MAFVGIGAVSSILGLVRLMDSPSGPQTGRWRAVLGPVFDTFGARGVDVTFILIGVVLVGIGLLVKEHMK